MIEEKCGSSLSAARKLFIKCFIVEGGMLRWLCGVQSTICNRATNCWRNEEKKMLITPNAMSIRRRRVKRALAQNPEKKTFFNASINLCRVRSTEGRFIGVEQAKRRFVLYCMFSLSITSLLSESLFMNGPLSRHRWTSLDWNRIESLITLSIKSRCSIVNVWMRWRNESKLRDEDRRRMGRTRKRVFI